MFQDIQQIKQYVNISAQLDMRLLFPYMEEALRVRIYPYIPKEVCRQIQNQPYYELLKKSVANYMMAYAIPFLKVHLSNTGGNYLSDGKTQKSSWWDLRDWGLSAIGMADRSLATLMHELYISSYKIQIPLFQGNHIFQGLWDFEKHYNLSHSWEVYVRLLPVIERVWDLMIVPQLGVCSIDDLRVYDAIWNALQAATALFVVAEMVQLRGVSFAHGVMCIQWEELPWQSSKLLDASQLDKLHLQMNIRARAYLNKALQMIRIEKEKDPNILTCFTEQNMQREVFSKKSGLYL